MRYHSDPFSGLQEILLAAASDVGRRHQLASFFGGIKLPALSSLQPLAKHHGV